MPRLYLVHCGYYEPLLADGTYESHTNLFVVADSFEEAREKAKSVETFKSKRMHIDGLQEIDVVHGHRVRLERDPTIGELENLIASSRHRELVPKSN